MSLNFKKEKFRFSQIINENIKPKKETELPVIRQLIISINLKGYYIFLSLDNLKENIIPHNQFKENLKKNYLFYDPFFNNSKLADSVPTKVKL